MLRGALFTLTGFQGCCDRTRRLWNNQLSAGVSICMEGTRRIYILSNVCPTKCFSCKWSGSSGWTALLQKGRLLWHFFKWSFDHGHLNRLAWTAQFYCSLCFEMVLYFAKGTKHYETAYDKNTPITPSLIQNHHNIHSHNANGFSVVSVGGTNAQLNADEKINPICAHPSQEVHPETRTGWTSPPPLPTTQMHKH